MRVLGSSVVWFLALASGCGDGVGRPILPGDAVTSGAPATAGSGSGGGAGGSGAPAMAGGGAGLPGGMGGANSGGDNGNGRAAGGSDLGGPPWGGTVGEWGAGSSFGGSGPGVPAGDYCARAADWPAEADAAEQALFQFLNFARESGFACAEEETASAPPVGMVPELRCAARLHSLDMSERNFFDHVNPDGVGPEDRIRRTGYSFGVASESIAEGERSPYPMVPYEALAQLFEAGGSDCRNLADPRFDSVGIGFFQGLWTLDFAGR